MDSAQVVGMGVFEPPSVESPPSKLRVGASTAAISTATTSAPAPPSPPSDASAKPGVPLLEPHAPTKSPPATASAPAASKAIRRGARPAIAQRPVTGLPSVLEFQRKLSTLTAESRIPSDSSKTMKLRVKTSPGLMGAVVLSQSVAPLPWLSLPLVRPLQQ